MKSKPTRPHVTARELLARYVELIGPRGEETPQSQALLDAHDDKVFHSLAVQARELKMMFARSHGHFRGTP